MPSLSCLSIFEPGQFGSSPGNVIITTAAVPFPISTFVAGAGRGASFAYAAGEALVGRSARSFGSSWAYASYSVLVAREGHSAGASYAVAEPLIQTSEMREGHSFGSSYGVASPDASAPSSSREAMLPGVMVNETSSNRQAMLPGIFINEA